MSAYRQNYTPPPADPDERRMAAARRAVMHMFGYAAVVALVIILAVLLDRGEAQDGCRPALELPIGEARP